LGQIAMPIGRSRFTIVWRAVAVSHAACLRKLPQALAATA
jgi:hypothetical protein